MQNVISIDEAKKEAVIDEAMEAARIVLEALRRAEEAMQRLRNVRARATDLVLDNEEIKRDFIGECDRMIATVDSAASILHLGPMPTVDFRNELMQAMSLRINDLANAPTAAAVQEILLERCNNIAGTCQDRVVRDL